MELLSRLLQVVTWEEALARAIAELLGGKWMKRYPDSFRNLEASDLWPAQKEAIGMTLYVLDNHGSALIADPTGSGKTKAGALTLGQLQTASSTSSFQVVAPLSHLMFDLRDQVWMFQNLCLKYIVTLMYRIIH